MSDSIAIIGAGLAGTVLSQRLNAAGLTVTIYEKSRGTGGRMASCRLEGTSADLGAALLCATPDTPFFGGYSNKTRYNTGSPLPKTLRVMLYLGRALWRVTA